MIVGVVKELLLPSRSVPPVAAVNQSTTEPAGADADNSTLPVPQRPFDVTDGAAGTVETTTLVDDLVEDTHPVAGLRDSAK